MQNGAGQRGARLRLARQRPTPDRVRARARDGNRPGAWWQRIDWTKWGAVVGVVAGIGTLLFTGVATYYGARVSADQLAQSQEDAARQSRDQAMRISYWVDRAPTGETRLHLMNRSPDPVTGVILNFSVEAPRSSGQIVVLDEVRFSEELLSVAPCSEIIFDVRAMGYWVKGKEDPVRLPDLTQRINVKSVIFTDRDGTLWVRAPRKLVTVEAQSLLEAERLQEETPRQETPWKPPALGGPSRPLHGVFEGEPATKQAASCGAPD